MIIGAISKQKSVSSCYIRKIIRNLLFFLCLVKVTSSWRHCWTADKFNSRFHFTHTLALT